MSDRPNNGPSVQAIFKVLSLFYSQISSLKKKVNELINSNIYYDNDKRG